MRTISVNLYKYNELSDKAKKVALSDNQNINVEHNWWDMTYDDMTTVDIEGKSFNLDRGSECTLAYLDDLDVVADKILEHHGESCHSYKGAKAYKASKAKIDAYRDNEGDSYSADDRDEVNEDTFKDTLEAYYLQYLREEYEYLMSDECIAEHLVSNDYDFTSNGTMYS